MNKYTELKIRKRKIEYRELQEKFTALGERNDEIHEGLAFVRKKLAGTENGVEQEVWLENPALLIDEMMRSTPELEPETTRKRRY